jgi:bifunctional DNA-binding transcriptional regulator/antitoxin component of YhaV-PrlF toxin-antitoxin module
MTLMRGFSRVDMDGKIRLPVNIKREMELKKGHVLELKIMGSGRKKAIMITTTGIVGKRASTGRGK